MSASTEKNKELMEVTDVAVSAQDGMSAEVSLLDTIKNPSTQFFCTIAGEDRASKAAIYNAVNSKGESLSDAASNGIILEVTDVACHPVRLVNKETGEVNDVLRTVLICTDGKTYSAVSEGVISSLQKLFALFGMPTWNEPVKLKPVTQKTNNGFRVLTLQVVA